VSSDWLKKKKQRLKVLDKLFGELVKYDGDGNPRCKNCGMILYFDFNSLQWDLPFIHPHPVCEKWKNSGMYYYGYKKGCKRKLILREGVSKWVI